MLRDFGIVTVVDLTRVAARRDARAAGGADVGRAARRRSACVTWSRTRRAAPRRTRRERRPLRATSARAAPRRDRRPARRARPHASRAGATRPRCRAPGNKYAWAVGIVRDGAGRPAVRPDAPEQRRGPRGPRAGRLGSRPSPPRRRSATSRATRTSARRQPCPEQAGRRARLRARSRRTVVNVCELRRRPLVLTFIFDRGADCYPQVDRTERVRASCRACTSRPSSSRARSATRCARLVAGARLAPAGGDRRGWRGRQPLRRRRLPDHDLRPRRRRVARHEARQPDRGPAAPARRPARADGARARAAEGWVEPELAEEFPELGLVHAPLEARPREPAARRQGAAARAGRPLHRRQGDPHAPGRRARGPTGSSRARSASTPTPTARRSRRSRSSACATAACGARTSSTTRSRSRSPRPACRVFALDADRVAGELGLRLARAGEQLAGVRPLSARQLVVADDAARWRWCSARWPTTPGSPRTRSA